MLELLKKRFDENMNRHPDMSRDLLEARLRNNGEAISILKRMEESGGEPDTIGFDAVSEKIIFCGCPKE